MPFDSSLSKRIRERGAHVANVVFWVVRLTLVDLPISVAIIAELQEAVLWVVALTAMGTFQIAAPSGPLAIVVFGDGKSGPAAAGDEEHFEVLIFALGHSTQL